MACSASGSQLPELKASLKRLQGRKDAELEKEQGTRDRELLRGLKIDLDRVQAAITAQSFEAVSDMHTAFAIRKLSVKIDQVLTFAANPEKGLPNLWH